MQKKFKYTKKMREKQNNWQRIEAVIKWANMSTNYFARYIGLARGENLYQIKRGNNGISLDVADRIVNKFPQVDKLWLLTGEGQMFSETKLRGAQIPFYNADVEQSVTRIEQLEAECNLVVPPAGECDFAMRYSGRAMGEAVPSGTVVLLKAVGTDDYSRGRICGSLPKNCNFAHSTHRGRGGTVPSGGRRPGAFRRYSGRAGRHRLGVQGKGQTDC